MSSIEPPSAPSSESTSLPPPPASISDGDSSNAASGKTPAEEGAVIKALHDFAIQAGGKYYLVEGSWWQQWKDWVGYDTDGVSSGARPQALDNTPLLQPDSTTRLKTTVQEGMDFELVTPAEWSLLEQWYGGQPPSEPEEEAKATSSPGGDGGGSMAAGRFGPAILRRGVADAPTYNAYGGSSSSGTRRATVELHGINIKVVLSTEVAKAKAAGEVAIPRHLNVSKASTVRELKETILQQCNVVGLDVRLWDYFNKQPYALLDTPSKTLTDCQIMENNDLLVELPDEDGKFHIQPPKKAVNIYGGGTVGGTGASENVVTSAERPIARGVVGLTNLGNTCFMNSTLQCLSSTPPLRDYFVSGAYLGDINRSNPLGNEGKLAESFGDLMNLMWPAEGSVSTVAPRGFKYEMGRFRPEFQGYQQHDSSELMNFLLDGLHEDLNRVVDKPYVEALDADPTKSDEETAHLFLEQHKLRNHSFVHDLFMGQFKSTLVCPECDNVSVAFDPYTMVSLPLQTAAEERSQTFKVAVWTTGVSSSKALGEIKEPEAPATITTTTTTTTDVPMEVENAIVAVKNDKEEDEAKPGAYVGRTKTEHKLLVPKGCKAQVLREAIAEAAGLPLASVALCASMNHNPHAVQRFLGNDASLEFLTHSTLHVHEVADANAFTTTAGDYKPVNTYYPYRTTPIVPEVESPYAAVTIYFRRKIAAPAAAPLYASAYYKPKTTELFGSPLLLCHPKTTSTKALYEAVARAVSPKEGAIRPEAFSLFVAKDTNAYTVETSAVSRDNVDLLDGGMKAKLVLVLEFSPEEEHFALCEGMPIPGAPGVVPKLTTPAPPAAVSSTETDVASGGGGAVVIKDNEDDDDEKEKNEAAKKEADENLLRLERCFELFSTPEKLSPEDSWYCGKCKQHVEATKSMELWSVPDVLVLHLKRFSYSRWARDKIETDVHFPLDGLDVSPYVKGPIKEEGGAIFDCVAVSNHMGSLGGGHYTASARSLEDNQWYKFNDSYVSTMSPEAVNSGDVYLLFYVRRAANFVPKKKDM